MGAESIGPERLDPYIEFTPELPLMCGLDPRMDCPIECPNYDFMKKLWSRIAGNEGRYISLVQQFRDPENSELLENFRRQQSEMFRKQSLNRLCQNYPASDIARK